LVAGRSPFDEPERVEEPRGNRQAADRKILNGALRLRAPQCARRDRELAHAVLFCSVLRHPFILPGPRSSFPPRRVVRRVGDRVRSVYDAHSLTHCIRSVDFTTLTALSPLDGRYAQKAASRSEERRVAEG